MYARRQRVILLAACSVPGEAKVYRYIKWLGHCDELAG